MKISSSFRQRGFLSIILLSLMTASVGLIGAGKAFATGQITHLALSTNGALIGDILIITATITDDTGTLLSSGSGTVDFSYGPTPLCTGVGITAGVATCTIQNTFLEARTLTAVFTAASGPYSDSTGAIDAFVPQVVLTSRTIYYSHPTTIHAELQNPMSHAILTSAQGLMDVYSSNTPIGTCSVVNGVLAAGCDIPAGVPDHINLTFQANFPAISIATNYFGADDFVISTQPVSATNGDRQFQQTPVLSVLDLRDYKYESGAYSCSVQTIRGIPTSATSSQIYLSGKTDVQDVNGTFTFDDLGISGTASNVALAFYCNFSIALHISNTFNVSAAVDTSTYTRTVTVTNVQTQQVDRIKKPQLISLKTPLQLTTTSPGETLTASSDSGLPVSFKAFGTCEIKNGLVTPTGSSGVCVLLASQSGNDIYAPAEPVVVALNITVPISDTPVATSQNKTEVVTPEVPRGKQPNISAELIPLIKPVKIYFNLNTYFVNAPERKQIKALAAKLIANTQPISISVTGYSQPTKIDPLNSRALSLARAKAVADLLASYGVATPIKVIAGGLAPESNHKGRYALISVSIK